MESSKVAPTTTPNKDSIMSTPVLGKLITDKPEMDAVHIAIAPVFASETLKPGQHIGVDNKEERTVSSKAKHCGIVDPLLKKPVVAGDCFYIWMYPNTITSLKHSWTHPDFEEVAAPVQDDNYMISRAYLEVFAEQCELTYAQLMVATLNYLNYGEGYTLGTDTPSIAYDGDNFWRHYAVVTKKKINQDTVDNGLFFRCAC